MKKTYIDFYRKSKKINYLTLPEMNYITIEGKGGPAGKEFLEAIPLLYKMAYTLRMSYKQQLFTEFEKFVVGPLEGIWTTEDNKEFNPGDNKSILNFKLMIVQPKWFTKEMFDLLMNKIRKDFPDIKKLNYEVIEEGKCVQILHIGKYENQNETLKRVHKDLIEKEYQYIPSSHHEIYLSDARKVSPERLNTIIRYQIK